MKHCTWEIVRGVTCVVCPDCAFTFSMEHTDDTPDGGYSCPNCENIATPEYVECPTCGGVGHNRAAEHRRHPCPDCTTENVEGQT